MRKHVRATQDVDVLLQVEQGAVEIVLQVVKAGGFRPKTTPPTVSLGSFEILQLEFEPADALVAVRADLLLVHSSYHLAALARRVTITLPELRRQIAVLSCEDLLLHKLLAGRIIDLADAAALLRANHEALDRDYLRRWARPLNLEEELRRVWAGALPGAGNIL